MLIIIAPAAAPSIKGALSRFQCRPMNIFSRSQAMSNAMLYALNWPIERKTGNGQAYGGAFKLIPSSQLG